MNLRSLAGSGLTALLVVLVVAMLVGQQLGQPIVLGFVLTGSMNTEPSNMAPGDGFVAVPPAMAGDVVVIPRIGVAVTALQGAFSAAAAFLSGIPGPGGSPRATPTRRWSSSGCCS